MENKENKLKVSFSALDPYIEENIILPTEKEVRGQGFIEWGTKNTYPTYLYSLYESVPTLQAVINGIVDYVCGDEVVSNIEMVNDKKMREYVRNIAYDLVIYGGTAVNVLRNRMGGIAQLSTLDLRNVRMNKKAEMFWYSEDFQTKSYGRAKYLTLPKFDNTEKQNSSIYYYKRNRFGVYPIPMWGASVLACETEKNITDFHYNAIRNGFASNVIVNMNNGVPADEIREEIEAMFNDKFCGAENSARPLICFNQDKDHSVSIERLDVDGFADRYDALQKRTKQEIFTAFKANPNLFGINTENNGFATEQFADSFALFQKTTIQPLQNEIVDIIDEIYGVEGCVTIKPFSINFGDVQSNEEIENEE